MIERDLEPVPERPAYNPLIEAIGRVLMRLSSIKDEVREFYFELIMAIHPCPCCGGRMKMTGASECSCSCGLTIDPTAEFQKSNCCGVKVVKRILHYACSHCGRAVPSMFLFDERIFDNEYFREAMRASRERKLQRRAEIKRLLANSRSGTFHLEEELSLSAVPGLEEALEEFIGNAASIPASFSFEREGEFHMGLYHEHILAILRSHSVLFSNIPTLVEDARLDRVRRFVTLIYMQHEREVELTQYETDILVERDEAYA